MAQYDRQIDFFNPNEEKNQVPIIVIGAGTIGSWTTLALAKLGLKDITVFDGDKVEPHNVSNQIYPYPKDSWLDISKVETLKKIISSLTSIEIKNYACNFPHLEVLPITDIILIVAVDSMKSRKEIWEWVKLNQYKIKFFIDARTGGEVSKIYTLVPTSVRSIKYEQTLHSDDMSSIENETVRRLSEVPCTAQSIVDVSFFVASRIINSTRNFIIGKHIPPFFTAYDMSRDIWLVDKE